MKESEKRLVYVDNAATTPITKEVLDAMLPWLTEGYGNASTIYEKGREAGWALKRARETCAACLGADADEIYFTSGGSESDNWALKGAAEVMAKRGKKHIITSAFEHHAVLHSCMALEKQGFEVTYLPVYKDGIVRVEDVAAAIRPDTGLVSIMYANNEVGTIQPIPEIGALCREKKIWFHTDAVQAVGHIPIDVHEQNIDMLSLSGHKIHSMKGVGLLYVRKGISLPNLIDGGSQERNKRAGTENIAGIVGLAKALELATTDIEERAAKTRILRDRLIDNILKIDRTRLNGDRERRLPGNVNISIEGIEGEGLLLWLDHYGICASSGSACTSGSLDPSHVLLALGLPHEVAHGSLRITLGDQNTEEDVEAILAVLPEIVERLRGMSPLWEKIQAGEPSTVKMIR
ncbi:MAG TPA: cysteine desulfurase NifS [Oscillospiraceae bacterium]|nr:cysteine desulfurase NifS [Oscillospiraceae bacterium]HXK77799.1 cysteine desulfurase NifS [Oscillospiraceae bacterium]